MHEVTATGTGCVPDRFVPSKGKFDTCRNLMVFSCQDWYIRLWAHKELFSTETRSFLGVICFVSWSDVDLAVEAIQGLF